MYNNDQYYGLERIDAFVDYAEERGYEFRSSIASPEVGDPNRRNEQFVAALQAENPDAVMLVCPNRFEQPELEVLRQYVQDGGAVLLIDQSDFVVEEVDLTDGLLGTGKVDRVPDPNDIAEAAENGNLRKANNEANPNEGDNETQVDSSTILNTIAEYLGAAFRFNDGSVADRANSFAGAAVTARSGGGDIGGEVSGEQPEVGTAGEKIFFTGGFDTDRFPQLFDDRDGLDGDDAFFRYRAPVDYVIDGDSISFKWVSEEDGVFDTRALGIDTPEDGGDQPFERPVEWEGLANEDLPVIGTGELQVEQACSLLDTGRRPIAPDDPDIAVSSADTATNEAPGDGNGSATVDYGEGPIPLVGVDDNAVAVGSLLVDGGTGDENTNEDLSVASFDFLLNVWDDQTGGGKTVLYDESHGQPALGDKYGPFVDYATYQEGENDTGIGAPARPKAVYDLQSSQDLLADLDGAAAVWITPPDESFSGQEIARLRQFMNDGGSVFLHGMDATREDAFTANLNQLARRLGIRFRFNADRVVDSDNDPYLSARNFNHDYPFFLLRQCDTNTDYDRDRYFGHDYLISWGNIAGLSGAGGLVFEDQVAEFELDPDAAALDGLGRPLGYLYVDLDNDGEVETNYNKWTLEQGLARVYDGGHSRHDEFLKAELRARRDNRGLWRKSEPLETGPIRNRPVEELYVPQATAVRTESGRLRRSRAPVLAEPTASDSEAPLVGVDESRNLAMVGGPMPAESYEIREDDYRSVTFVTDLDPFQVNTAGYENYAFLANLLLTLSDRDGDVYIDGGHSQFGGGIDRFGGNYTLSAEDSRYLDRFLEGVNVGYNGINDIPENLLDGMDGLAPSRALIVTTPRTPFTDEEVAAVEQFIDAGGSVVLMGSAEAPDRETAFLNDLAARLGTDLRIDGAPVLDEINNLRGQARLPTTSNLNRQFDDMGLFDEVPVRQVDREIDTRTTVNAAGSRSVPEIVEEDEIFRIDVTVENVDRPVKIRDAVEGRALRSSNVIEEKGDVTHVEMGGRGAESGYDPNKIGSPALNYVELGEVTPEDVKGDRTVTRSYFLEYRINDRNLKSGTSSSNTVYNIVEFETGPTIAAFYAGPENKEFLGYVNEKKVGGTDETQTRVRPKADPETLTGDSQTADTDSNSVADGTAGEVIRSAPTEEDEDDESILDT
ncbi:hypothetical protein BRC85_09865 [Halobacteriales archaeon QS_1_69_70]|nr:MAG: hypothetical protein BRC85_09865 [Halobacteriales archaeon QS_1_69_70]